MTISAVTAPAAGLQEQDYTVTTAGTASSAPAPIASLQTNRSRLAMRIGAGFLLGNMIATIALALATAGSKDGFFLNSTQVYALIFNFLGMIGLWQASRNWKAITMVRAVCDFVVAVVATVLTGSNFLIILIFGFYSLSLLLLLPGSAGRARMGAAIGLYLLGYQGITVLLILAVILINLLHLS